MVAGPNPLDRPAFYALRPGGWRDLLTLLHPPYTAWHLSYVALGAAAAPKLHGDRLAATLLAFFLGVGVCAHALDELNGRPLRTLLSDGLLVGLAVVALAGAVAIGIVGAATVSLGLVPLIAAGAFIVVAYNLELFGGWFHSSFWFAAAWGAFPALTAYWINALEFRLQGILVAAGCFMLSLAQRRLSTPVRELRRHTVSVSGRQRLADGTTIELDAARLAAPLDDALRACALALALLAAGLVIARL
jgi:ABC-type branched-subunit amino acid transport system permease subunit